MPSLFDFINDMVKSKRSPEDEEPASAPPISLLNWPDLGIAAAPTATKPTGDALAGASGSATLAGGSGDDDLKAATADGVEEKRFPSPSDAQVDEQAKGRHDAWQSGDPERMKGADNAISHYSGKDQDRIREAAERLVKRGPKGEVILAVPPRPEDTGPIDPRTLTGEKVYDALRAPKDPSAFARGDWKKKMEATLDALAELERTDRDEAAKILQEVVTLHEERDDYHARFGKPFSLLPDDIRDGFLRGLARYPHMTSEERNDFARQYRPYLPQDPDFLLPRWGRAAREGNGEPFRRGTAFLTKKELEERIVSSKDLQIRALESLRPDRIVEKPGSALLAPVLAVVTYLVARKREWDAQSDLDRRNQYQADH